MGSEIKSKDKFNKPMYSAQQNYLEARMSMAMNLQRTYTVAPFFEVIAEVIVVTNIRITQRYKYSQPRKHYETHIGSRCTDT